MKKEYLILIAIILFAGSYLFLHKEDQANYKLPEITAIDTAKITRIIIKKDQGTIKFTKKNKDWVLTDKELPADSSLVQNMFDTFKTFKLTALVSQKSDLQRYELDEKKSINIKLLDKEKTIFEFTVGKQAPSFNHTFVMIASDKNIYHAKGSFRADFNKTVDEFKEKPKEPEDSEKEENSEQQNSN